MPSDERSASQIAAARSEWKFTQCFGDKGTGDEPVQDADIISAVEFDYSGSFLATGDKGGRIVLFEGVDSKKRTREFKFYTEFQSHEPEFDYLKSLEIEEKINKIKWLRPQNNALLLLSTNDKTIKLWRIYHKVIPEFDDDMSNDEDGTDEDDDDDDDEHLDRNDSDDSDEGPNGKYDGRRRSPSRDSSKNHQKGRLRSPADSHHLPRKFSKSSSNHGSGAGTPTSTVIGSSTMTPPASSTSWHSSQLKIPSLLRKTPVLAAYPRKTYANAHAYHINSISVGSDRETFISADDLRIHLWNLNHSDQSFNIIDIKPPNMEELTEVITAAEFHPVNCHNVVYSSSRGIIRLADLRQHSLCDKPVRTFDPVEDPATKSFFSEIISSLSDVKFSPDGKYIMSRDFLTVKIWDCAMEKEPVRVIPVHDFLRSKLCDLYENDYIFDKFECSFSGDGKSLSTGSYSSYFHIFDLERNEDIMLQADRQSIRSKKSAIQMALQGAAAGAMQSTAPSSGFRFNLRNLGKKKEEPVVMPFNVDEINYGRRILHSAWHPTEYVMAVAAVNNLFICSQVPSSASVGSQEK